jgi:Co/Zn/Cd efflux system component
MERSIFLIKKMDCASEESMVRMKLDGIEGIHALSFDIPNRTLTITHDGDINIIKDSIDELNFASSLVTSEAIETNDIIAESPSTQSALLWKILIINFSFFIIEIIAGFIARSMGLVADSLDMLADALVYSLSLIAVRGTLGKKKRIAGISGYFQLILAIVGFIEVIRRFLEHEDVPDFKLIIIVSFFALLANALCLYLLQSTKSEEVHMKASMIFTSNDVIINVGVIVAGVLVFILDSKYPDLIIGAIVFILVTRGAFSILKLSR